MKKEQKTDLFSPGSNSLMKAFMMLVFSLFTFAVSAQQSATSATAIQPVNSQSEISQDSPLMQFQKNHPNDVYSGMAIKYAMILENTSSYPEFSKEDLDRFATELKGLTERINYMDQEIKNGATYEKASATYQRILDNKAAMERATNPDKSAAQPSNDVAPSIRNGNN